MNENDYLPQNCPVCGYFGTIGEFLHRGDKYHCRKFGREIKFRGRVPDKGWLFGDLRHIGNNLIYIVDKFGHGSSVNPETVGQFTGLKDADGREIYEGDIVECGSGRICQVVFFKSECACCFDLFPVGGFDCEPPKESTLWKDLTVIGNVYDNPELLEVTK